MSIRVIVNGAQGRMGQTTVHALNADNNFLLVGETTRNDNLFDSIKKNEASVVIDFTHPESVLKNTLTILDAGAHPVIGTSGLLPDEISLLQNRAKELKRGGVIAPNFSLGAVLMMKYAKEIAAYFSDVEIIEAHHAGKLDSPSGTALRTAEMINQVRTKKYLSSPLKETVKGARGALYQDIPIHSIRLPGILAKQEVTFGSRGETLTIQHNTIDRECFMPGVLLACKKVKELNQLIYGLEGIL